MQSTQWGSGHGRWGAVSTVRVGLERAAPGDSEPRGAEEPEAQPPHTHLHLLLLGLAQPLERPSTSSSLSLTAHPSANSGAQSRAPVAGSHHCDPPCGVWGTGCGFRAPRPTFSRGREGQGAPAKHHQGPQGPEEDTPLHRTSGEAGGPRGAGAAETPPRQPRPRPARVALRARQAQPPLRNFGLDLLTRESSSEVRFLLTVPVGPFNRQGSH